MKKYLTLLCALTLATTAWAEGAPVGVPTDPLAPNLTFRQLGEDKKSLLEEATGTNVTAPTNSLWQPIGETTQAQSFVVDASPVTSSRADARATGQFGALAAPEGKVVKQLAFDGWIVTSPLPYDEGLIVATENSLTRLNPNEGDVIWSLDLNGRVAPMALSGQRLFLATDAGEVMGIDAVSGKLLWRVQDENLVYRAGVAVADGRVFVGDMTKTLRALDARNGAELWTKKLSRGLTATPLVAEGLLLVGQNDTTFEALDPATGKTVFSGGTSAGIYHSATSKDGVVYFAGDDGVVKATKIDKVIPLWQSTALGSPVSSPLPSGKRVFIATTDGTIYCLDAATGKALTKTHVGAPLATEPVLVNDELLALADGNGTVHLIWFDENRAEKVTLESGGSDASPVAALGSLWVPSGRMLVEIR